MNKKLIIAAAPFLFVVLCAALILGLFSVSWHPNYNVCFLVVDKIHEEIHPQLITKLKPTARLVYSNSDIDIYEVDAK